MNSSSTPSDVTLALGFDGAMVCVVLFVLFFVVLVLYLRIQDKREGYPAIGVDDDGNLQPERNWLPMPWKKRFRRPHDRPPVETPKRGPLRPEPETHSARAVGGKPIVPARDGLIEGLGPAAWQEREALPRPGADGKPKLVRLSEHPDYFVAPGDPDPRGWAVLGTDGERAGTIVDLWFDRTEFNLRYFEVELEPGGRTGERRAFTLPLFFTDLNRRKEVVRVPHFSAARLADAPARGEPDKITRLDEDRVNAFFAGGPFYGETPLGEVRA